MRFDEAYPANTYENANYVLQGPVPEIRSWLPMDCKVYYVVCITDQTLQYSGVCILLARRCITGPVTEYMLQYVRSRCLRCRWMKEREVSWIFDIGHWTFECPMSNTEYPANFTFLMKDYNLPSVWDVAGAEFLKWLVRIKYRGHGYTLTFGYTGHTWLSVEKLAPWAVPG